MGSALKFGTAEDGLGPRASLLPSLSEVASVDTDAICLAESGYSQEMKQNFSVWSVLGVGFSLTNSWFGISTALVTGINSGGPLLIIYGIILVTMVSICVGISLSELASALPNSGGKSYQTSLHKCDQRRILADSI